MRFSFLFPRSLVSLHPVSEQEMSSFSTWRFPSLLFQLRAPVLTQSRSRTQISSGSRAAAETMKPQAQSNSLTLLIPLSCGSLLVPIMEFQFLARIRSKFIHDIIIIIIIFFLLGLNGKKADKMS